MSGIIVFLLAVLLHVSSKSDSNQRKGYILLLADQQAVNTLKQLVKQGLDNECGLDLHCDHFYESALIGASCQLTDEELSKLKKCLGSQIRDIKTDEIVQVQSSSRTLHTFLDEFEPSEEEYLENEMERVVISLPNTTSSEDNQELNFVSLELQAALDGTIRQRSPTSTSRSQQLQEKGFKTWQLPNGLWNLDRIDQKQLPLNSKYVFGGEQLYGTGKGVTIYVVDSGIRASHVEFEEWESTTSRVLQGYNSVDNNNDVSDCDGHGTHVASIAIGKGVGVAKQANVIGVRVLDCFGLGSAGSLVAGLDWVSANVQKPAIVTLSLGLKKNDAVTRTVEDVIQHMVWNQGIVFVVASGNSNQNVQNVQTSCDISPAHMSDVITVAASNLQEKFGFQRLVKTDNVESVYFESNTGPCVDIFAPGVDIYAACGGYARCQNPNDFSSAWQSGTSMAAPHVAGVAAIFLGEFPNATPLQVKQVLLEVATQDKINPSLMRPGTANKLLYSQLNEMQQVYNNLLLGIGD
eukprot:TRINITY_DN6498_c0_g1_i4.p1 TRINITY_DN6498_c0_g1~~TRINITY_DN6498_c0_g1_i4.p1  ORF type:complete len:561 (-),score=33.17 TRINITY_DN6498_c0_g1_i4:338-1900(-)